MQKKNLFQDIKNNQKTIVLTKTQQKQVKGGDDIIITDIEEF